MYIVVIMLLVASILVTPFIYSRTFGSRVIVPAVNIPAKPTETPPVSLLPQQPTAVDIASKNEIVNKLDDLLNNDDINDTWYASVNNLIIDLALIDKNLSNTYLKKVLDKTAQVAAEKKSAEITPPMVEPNQPPIVQPNKLPTIEPNKPSMVASKNDITQKLNDLLQQKVIDETWHSAINDLIFDLALIDRNLSNEYLKKVRIKTISVIPQAKPLPAQDKPAQKEIPAPIVAVVPEGIKKGTPPPPPGAMKKGTPPPPPSAEMAKKEIPAPPSGAMQKGTPPPPPSVKKGTPPPPPGPMPKGGKKAAPVKTPTAVAAPKGPEPLTIKESYGARQLEKRTTQELMELFNKLLEALGTYADFWDAIQKKPKLDWENKINTLKKALLDPKRNIQMDVAKLITDRIAQVKDEKAKQGLEKQAAAQQAEVKATEEELSQEEVIAKIEALKKRPNISDFKWLIEFQGNVKKLDKINHEKALEYEAEFTKKFPGQKAFLPKKKQ